MVSVYQIAQWKIPSIITTYNADTDSRIVIVVSIRVSASAQNVAAHSIKRIRIGKAYRTCGHHVAKDERLRILPKTDQYFSK